MPVLRLALPVPLPQCFDYWSQAASEADIGRLARVPFGTREKIGLIIALDPSDAMAPEKLKEVIEIQRELMPLPLDWIELVSFVARYYHAPLGEVVAVALPPDLRRAKAVKGKNRDALLCLSIQGRAALETARARESKARRLAQQILSLGPVRRSVIAALPERGSLSELMRKGWVETVQASAPGQPCADLPNLTSEQQHVLETVGNAPPGFISWLLHGVTASGKTEVYLRLTQAALDRGEQVLILVPEIALTPHLEYRVQARFPFANVVSLHSGLSAGERSCGYVQSLEGQAHIILGTRLAVFAPLPKLGLIIIDEEHDASFKQQEGVRYNARDVAIWRAHKRGVPIILGSATPALETWQHALSGRYRKLSLTQRAVALQMPRVEVFDTRCVPTKEGISTPLYCAIAERLERGEQSLIFLNRRGYAPVLACTACMWISPCPHCAANLVFHLKDRRQRCHHCGFDTPAPRACPSCGNQDIQPLGRGTQRIEAYLEAEFPQARVLRLDRDAARSRVQWERMLAQISEGKADILVGTQMMAKGHDFPRLTLVGVLGVDAALHAADFRAPERLFQQLMQVGGRAGRAVLSGEVMIQTEYPDYPLFKYLVKQDYGGFAAQALQERKQAGFPPFTYQAMLRADAPQSEYAEDFLKHAVILGQTLCQEVVFQGHIRIYDPVPMRLSRLAQRERIQLLVEADQRMLLQAFLQKWVEQLHAKRTHATLRWHVDVDPFEV